MTSATKNLGSATAQGLIAQGWQRCFIADEPRLSEAVETYEELGFEVQLLPVPEEDGQCTQCMRLDPNRFRVIFTRKRADGHSRGDALQGEL